MLASSGVRTVREIGSKSYTNRKSVISSWTVTAADRDETSLSLARILALAHARLAAGAAGRRLAPPSRKIRPPPPHSCHALASIAHIAHYVVLTGSRLILQYGPSSNRIGKSPGPFFSPHRPPRNAQRGARLPDWQKRRRHRPPRSATTSFYHRPPPPPQTAPQRNYCPTTRAAC